jgi:glycosyltransferase involved in cell wall biosynthesis
MSGISGEAWFESRRRMGMQNGRRLSATVIAQNEAAQIGDCLDSLSWADEIIVVDGGSTDGTQEICRAKGVTVLEKTWSGYAAQKNYALDNASCPWVLSLDADERVTDELRSEIESLLDRSPVCDGYYVPRKNIFWGRQMRGRAFYPDHQMRLFRKEAGRFNDRAVHESVEITGQTGTLRGALEHRSYESVGDYLRRIERYSALAASDMKRRGIRPSWAQIWLRPPARFIRNYVLKRGFVDGMDGLIVSALDAFHVFAKYARLREISDNPDV